MVIKKLGQKIQQVDRLGGIIAIIYFFVLSQTSQKKMYAVTDILGILSVRGASILYFFWNFNRNQTENDSYWQKITFYFLQNVWNCTFFSHLHLKYAKSAIMTQKKFSWKVSVWVSKKRRILCWFQFHWCRLSEMPLTKVKSKKPRKNAQKQKYSKFA